MSKEQAEIAELQKQLTAANAEKEETQLALLEAEEANEVLSSKIAEKKSDNKKGFPSVTIDKEKFQFTMPAFTYKSKHYTAEQASKDLELCKELIKIKASCLKSTK